MGGAVDLARERRRALGRAPEPAHPRVDLQVDAHPGAHPRGRAGQGLGAVEGVHRDGDAAADHLLHLPPHDGAEDQDGRRDASRPQGQGLGGVADAEGVDPVPQEMVRDRDRAVAVGVGLHHEHDRRVRGRGAHPGEVALEGAEVDFRPCASLEHVRSFAMRRCIGKVGPTGLLLERSFPGRRAHGARPSRRRRSGVLGWR